MPNVLSPYPTCFITGSRFIEEITRSPSLARPTEWRLGTPIEDDYYVEIWAKKNTRLHEYVALEATWTNASELDRYGATLETTNPFAIVATPFMTVEGLYGYECVLNQFVLAALNYRRNNLWIKHERNSYEATWLHTRILDAPDRKVGPLTLIPLSFDNVRFHANPAFVLSSLCTTPQMYAEAKQ
jgi:hypothetical protein